MSGSSERDGEKNDQAAVTNGELEAKCGMYQAYQNDATSATRCLQYEALGSLLHDDVRSVM